MEGVQDAWKSHKQGAPSIEAKVFDKSTKRKRPSSGTDHDHHHKHLLESGLLKTDFGEICDRYYGFQTEAGKAADPRTLRLLEFFRQLYYRRQETFRKMVPSGLQDEFEELFKKIGALLTPVKSEHEVRTMQRSLSVGSGLKLDRFKVRTVHVDGSSGGGGGGGGGLVVKQIGQGGQGDKAK